MSDEKPPELEWIPMSQSPPPSSSRRILGKIADNPFVPLGFAATVVVLAKGLGTMLSPSPDMRRSNVLMRWRIFFQGFTFVAILAGFKKAEMDRKRGM